MIIAGKGVYYDAHEAIQHYLWIARVGPSGTLDTSFGANGFVYIEHAYGRAAIIPDGANLVLLGYSAAPREETSDRMTAWGLTLQGTRNPAFGNGGMSVVATTSGYNCAEFSAVTIDPSGRLLLAGQERDVTIHVANPTVPVLVRLSPNGSLDGGFGNGGYALGPPHTWFTALAIDSQERVLAAGTQAVGVGEHEDAFVERFLSNESMPEPKESIPEPKSMPEPKESIPASPPAASPTGGELSPASSTGSATRGELKPALRPAPLPPVRTSRPRVGAPRRCGHRATLRRHLGRHRVARNQPRERCGDCGARHRSSRAQCSRRPHARR
jgi:uncharacterized delta-60 repeat protein